MFIALPAGIGIALTSDQIVEVFLGSQWSSASVYLRWLSLAVMLTAYYQPVSSLCVAIDQPNLFVEDQHSGNRHEAPAADGRLLHGGLLLMLYARVVAAALHFLISAVYARRVIGTSLTAQMRNLWQVVVSCIAMALAVLLLENLLQRFAIPSIAQLVAMSACGAVVYAASMHLCGFRLRAPATIIPGGRARIRPAIDRDMLRRVRFNLNLSVHRAARFLAKFEGAIFA